MQSRHAFTPISLKSLSQQLKKRPPISVIKQIHAQIITRSFKPSHRSLIDSLVLCYLDVKSLRSARILFNSYPFPSPPILLWNLMIRAYSKLQNVLESINLFHRMLTLEKRNAVVPDEYTYTFVITSCSHQESIVHGEVVHGMVLKNGVASSLYVANSLINMYGNFARDYDARTVFDKMLERDVFSWTSLLRAYAKNGKMCTAGKIFGKMPVKNDVSWAVMISGFVNCGRFKDAISAFREMVYQTRPNEAVLVCTLSACAHLGSLDQGNWIHDYVDKHGIFQTSNVMTALIDMNAKCGRIDRAFAVFGKILNPDVQNFTSMITGFSVHGLGEAAIHIFNQMLAKKLKPNHVTVLGVLNGCSHGGLVNQGSLIFYNMMVLWGLDPKIEHYGCYVDLLGRSGYLAKAFGVVKSMPLNPDIIIWRALLSACRIQHNFHFGDRIISHLEQLSARSCDGVQVLLSNLYPSRNKWDKFDRVRSAMESQKKPSDVGCSLVEINGISHEFRVAEVLHPQMVEIQKKLNEIMLRISQAGYEADPKYVSFDLSEEDKVQVVAWHSEKLAIAFALINTLPGTSIRIVKNLRTCDDCHNALKAISKVYEREIIVRDRCRFHTFRQGNCSCNDFW